jgi:hypothetical protein
MKSVTEFANVTLTAAAKAKDALVAAGKTAEEIAAGLGEAFKYEGDKLKHFVNSLEVWAANKENLKRVLVVSLAEGENAPAKAVQVEAHHYVPEFHVEAKKAQPAQSADKGGRGGKGGGRGGPGKGKGGGKGKESPWGMSPEEKEAKRGTKPAPIPKQTF